MAAVAFAFVDTIQAAPAVRLDLQSAPWSTLLAGTSFPPPPLRRAYASTLLQDGEPVTAAAYGNRTITLQLLLEAVDHPAAEVQMQLLARELDRVSNFLRVDSDSGNPVFFRTFRVGGDYAPTRIIDGKYYFTVQIPAEPFAYGVREDVAVGAVTNNPDGGCKFDISSPKGDVAAPLLVKNTANNWGTGGVIAARHHGALLGTGQWYGQAESMTLGVDTTNPGGGPDAAMSGTGTNNYVRCTFATDASMQDRVTWAVTNGRSNSELIALRGRWRVMAAVRVNAGATTVKLQAKYGGILAATQGSVSTISGAAAAARQLVDLGLITIGGPTPDTPGRVGANLAPGKASAGANLLTIQAQRTAGASSIDFDLVYLVPADESLVMWPRHSGGSYGLVDSESESIYSFDTNTDPFGGSANLRDDQPVVPVVGGFPFVLPGQVNRFYLILGDVNGHDVTTSSTVAAHYWPRYLYVRPSGL